MANNLFDIARFLTTTLSGLVFVYGAYWAFSIRKALAVRVYRNQALGIGLIALSFAIFSLEADVISGVFNIVSGPILIGTYIPVLFASAIFTFYWIDSSVKAARRTDPLFRDTLHWSDVRVACWALMIVGLAVFLFVYGLNIYQTIPALSDAWITIPLVTGLSGVIVLPFSVLRSRDKTFRSHLKWFGIFVLFELVLTLSSILVDLLPLALVQMSYLIPTFALLLGEGYALYKSARSLAPLNTIPRIENAPRVS